MRREPGGGPERGPVVLAAAGMLSVAYGVGMQPQSLWYALLGAEFPWSRATLALGSTIFQLVAAVSGVCLGRLIDRHGIPFLLVLGTIALATGAAWLAVAPFLWMVYGAFAWLGLGFTALGAITVGKLLAPWFQGIARTRAVTLVLLGSQVPYVLMPLTTHLALRGGRLLLGGGLALLGLGLMTLLFPVLCTRPPVPVEEMADATQPCPLAEALRQGAYWRWLMTLCLVVLGQTGYVAHGLLIYAETTTLMQGAWLWTFAVICGVATRLTLCYWTPIGSPSLLAGRVYVVQALGFAALALAPAWPPLVWLGALGVGMTANLTLSVEILLAQYVCGTKTFGTLYGPVYASTRLMAALGVLLYGVVYSHTGSYAPMLWGVAGTLVVASLLVRTVTPLRTKTPLPGNLYG
jgi:MFS family permease